MSGAPVEWRPCSDRSRERDDPLAATGGRGLQWFLVENEGAWGTRAFLDPPFDVDLGRALVTRIESAGMRPLAIRRTGRHPERIDRGTPQRWRWAFVDSRPGHETVRWGEVDEPHQLLDVPLDGSAGVASDQPVFAVCAHARHDQCCAVRGRQVVARLAEAFPEETWECSHLGGDRFAGTMILFPHGLYYGRVDDDDAARIAESYRAGRIEEPFYRGRSSLTHPVQAAQHYARLEYGDDRVEAYAPLAAEWHDGGDGHARWTVTLAAPPLTPDPAAALDASAAAEPTDASPATGTLETADASGTPGAAAAPGTPGAAAAPGAPETALAPTTPGSADAPGTITVELAEAHSAPLLSTCAATRPGRVRQWDLVAITR